MELHLAHRRASMSFAIQTGAQRHALRDRLFLRIEEAGCEGVGEVSPQPDTVNGDPSCAEVNDELIHRSLPRLAQFVESQGELPPWYRLGSMMSSGPAARFSAALIEMAILDRHLRLARERLDDLWPPQCDPGHIRTVSILDDSPWIDIRGAMRVRIKCTPGADLALHAVELAAIEVPVIVDFNATAQSPNEVLQFIGAIRTHVDIAHVEQPFKVGNYVDTAALAAEIDIPIGLDESIRSVGDVERTFRYRAAKVVCVKPTRVGGFAVARTMVEKATSLGLDAYVGGFFESPYARSAHRIFAENTVNLPSDTAPVPDHDEFPMSIVSDSWGLRVTSELFEQSTNLLASH